MALIDYGKIIIENEDLKNIKYADWDYKIYNKEKTKFISPYKTCIIVGDVIGENLDDFIEIEYIYPEFKKEKLLICKIF